MSVRTCVFFYERKNRAGPNLLDYQAKTEVLVDAQSEDFILTDWCPSSPKARWRKPAFKTAFV